jgi:hypothetical protein
MQYSDTYFGSLGIVTLNRSLVQKDKVVEAM